MANPVPQVRPCDNKGWCVEHEHATYGPMESEAEARDYARLLQLVTSARSQIVCTDEVCWP